METDRLSFLENFEDEDDDVQEIDDCTWEEEEEAGEMEDYSVQEIQDQEPEMQLKIDSVSSIDPNQFYDEQATDKTETNQVIRPDQVDCIYCSFRGNSEVVQIHLEESHMCHECNEIFEQEADLNKHKTVHVKKKERVMMKCKFCWMLFDSKLSLYVHMQKKHTQKRGPPNKNALPSAQIKKPPPPVESSGSIIPLDDILNYYNYGRKTEAIEKSIFVRNRKRKPKVVSKVNSFPTFSEHDSARKISPPPRRDEPVFRSDQFKTYTNISAQCKSSSSLQSITEACQPTAGKYVIQNSLNINHNSKKAISDKDNESMRKKTSKTAIKSVEASNMKVKSSSEYMKGQEASVPEYHFVPNPRKSRPLRKVHLDDDPENSRYFRVKTDAGLSLIKCSSNPIKGKKIIRKSKVKKSSQRVEANASKRSLLLSRLAGDPARFTRLRAAALWRRENKRLLVLHKLMNSIPLSEPGAVPDLSIPLDLLMEKIEIEEREASAIVETKNYLKLCGKDENIGINETVIKTERSDVEISAEAEFNEMLDNQFELITCAGKGELKLEKAEFANNTVSDENDTVASDLIISGVSVKDDPEHTENDLNSEFVIVEEESTNESDKNQSSKSAAVSVIDAPIVDNSNDEDSKCKEQVITEQDSKIQRTGDLNISPGEKLNDVSESSQIPSVKKRRKSLLLEKLESEYIIEINNDEHDTYEELNDEFLPTEPKKKDKKKGKKRKAEDDSVKKRSKKRHESFDKNEDLQRDSPKLSDETIDTEKESKEKVKRNKKNLFKDVKLSRVPESNPYAKKVQSFRKNRKSDRSEEQQTVEENLEDEIKTNLLKSMQEPYCSICEILLERKPNSTDANGTDKTAHEVDRAAIDESLIQIPKKSVVWVPQAAVSSDDSGEKTFPKSRLLVCGRCKVCVHEACYGADQSNNWLCDRCTVPEKKTVLCYICNRSGGALKRTDSDQFYHVRCSVLIPELSRLQEVDLSLIPSKRWNMNCLICDRTGSAPAVHCMASRECMLSFHIWCADTHAVDCVLGPENSVILRCAFCIEKYKLKEEEDPENKFPPQDIEIGEKVGVLNHPGFKSGTVTAVDKEAVYAITFDEGSFCDSVDPDTVTFVDSGVKDAVVQVNCPVIVNWEGEKTSGIYRKTNTIFWYSVKGAKKKVLELARSDLRKLDKK